MKPTLFWILTILVIHASQPAPAQVKEWAVSYNGPGNGEDVGTDAVVDGSGNVYVTGRSDGGASGMDFLTIKYTREGMQEWAQRYNGTGNGDDAAAKIVVDEAGNVYVTGYSEGAGTGNDCLTIKYNSAGVMQWTARYNGVVVTQDDEAVDLTLDDAGYVYVAGRSSNSGIYYDWDYVTIKYSPSGAQEWAARYNGPGDDWDQANSVAVDSDGNVYVTGTHSTDVGTAYHDYATLKYNSAGALQWIRTLNGTGNNWDEGTSVGLDDAGNLYVTGFITGPGTVYDFVTMKFSPDGTEQWRRSHNTNGTPSADVPFAMAVTGAGDVFVAGATSLNMGAVKYNTSGLLQWSTTYDNGNFDAAYAISVTTAGGLVVAGVSSTGILESRYDYVTVLYSPSGEEQWVERHNGSSNNRDEAWGVATDDEGNIYVTGSTTTATGLDVTTIRYSTETAVQCGEITGFVARCNNIGVVQSQVMLRNSTIHSGETVTFRVDDVLHDATIASNGTHSRAQLSVSGLAPGMHIVELVSPPSCFGPINVECSNVGTVADLPVGEDGWNNWPEAETQHLTSLSLTCYPNPFNPSATIRFQIESDELVQLRIYDALGREVMVLVDGPMGAGNHEVVLNGTGLASGVYFARLINGSNITTRSLLLAK